MKFNHTQEYVNMLDPLIFVSNITLKNTIMKFDIRKKMRFFKRKFKYNTIYLFKRFMIFEYHSNLSIY